MSARVGLIKATSFMCKLRILLGALLEKVGATVLSMHVKV